MPRIDGERNLCDCIIPGDGMGPLTSVPRVVTEMGVEAMGDGMPGRGEGNVSAVVTGPCIVRISHVLSWLSSLSLLSSLLEVSN